MFTNAIQNPSKLLMSFLEESDDSPTGDVKYHLGTNYTWPTPERKYHSHLLPTHPLITHKSVLQWYVHFVPILFHNLGEWAIALHGRVLVPQGGWCFQYVNILYIGINLQKKFLGGAFKVSQLRIILLDVLN